MHHGDLTTMFVCLCVHTGICHPLSLFFRRLKSLAERHSQLCSSRSIQKPSTFLAKSFIVGRTAMSDDGEEEEDEERSGVRGGGSMAVPLCKDNGMGWERRVCSSLAPSG